MATIYLNAPKSQVDSGLKRSFEDILSNGIGIGYILSKADIELCKIGSRVIVLDKAGGNEAEGKLLKLVEKETLQNGQIRYDVHIEGFIRRAYIGSPRNLRRSGTLVVLT